MKKTVALDMDGTIVDYSEGWKGVDHFGPPINGAKEFTAEIATFAEILIHSTRLSSEFVKSPVLVRNKIAEWCEKHQITYHGIWDGTGKPIASAYVDDRAVEARPIPSKDLPQGQSYEKALETIKLLVSGTPADWPVSSKKLQILKTIRDERVERTTVFADVKVSDEDFHKITHLNVPKPLDIPGNLFLNPKNPESSDPKELGEPLGNVMHIKLDNVLIKPGFRIFTNDMASVEAIFGLNQKYRIPVWLDRVIMFVWGAIATFGAMKWLG